MLSSDVLFRGLFRLQVFQHICERHMIELYKLVWGGGVGGGRGAVQGLREHPSGLGLLVKVGFLLGLLPFF